MRDSLPHREDIKTPFNDFDMDLNAAQLIRKGPPAKSASLIKEIDLKPTEQQRILLGEFKEKGPPKGFSVTVAPDPNPAGSVIKEITSLGTIKHYRLILHVTNYGTKTVRVGAWKL